MSTSAPLKPEYALANDELGAWVRTYASGSSNPVSPKVKAAAAAGAAVLVAVEAVAQAAGWDLSAFQGVLALVAAVVAAYAKRDPLRQA